MRRLQELINKCNDIRRVVGWHHYLTELAFKEVVKYAEKMPPISENECPNCGTPLDNKCKCLNGNCDEV